MITKSFDKIKDVLQIISNEVKFIKRKGGEITPINFVQSLLGNNNKQTMSDEEICRDLYEDCNINLKRQSFNEWLHKDVSVEYLKKVFEKSLNINSIYNDEAIKGLSIHFKNIFIEDNTTISLHKMMNKVFKGVGGTASTSAMKIYYCYNAIANKIADIQIFDGTKSDAKCSYNVLDFLQKGDLILRDLGFFKIDSFKKIIDKGAYFLSRYFLATNLYIEVDGNDKKMSILEFIKSKKEFDVLDTWVKLSNEKLLVRVIVYRVPDEVYNQRVRNLKKADKHRGRTSNKSRFELQRYNIFITNIPSQMIDKKTIGTLYRFRWQVELVFKRWKSLLNINVITTTSQKTEDTPNKKGGKVSNRILCFIYAKLIGIILMSQIENITTLLARKMERELSSDKFVKWMIAKDKLKMLFLGKDSIEKVCKWLKGNLERMLKDRRKKDPTIGVLLENEVEFYLKGYNENF